MLLRVTCGRHIIKDPLPQKSLPTENKRKPEESFQFVTNFLCVFGKISDKFKSYKPVFYNLL